MEQISLWCRFLKLQPSKINVIFPYKGCNFILFSSQYFMKKIMQYSVITCIVSFTKSTVATKKQFQ